MARQLPKAIRLTDAAAEHLREIMARSEGKFIGLRVGVKNGGCAGMEYTMEYAEEQKPLDEVVEDKGVRILIDPKAILFLIGTEMDYQTEKFSSGFKFNNPNQTDACGCGESVTIEPARL
jgi:iron-sulfur cluster assembly protein